MAYLRETPVQSLKTGTVKRWPRFAVSKSRSCARAEAWSTRSAETRTSLPSRRRICRIERAAGGIDAGGFQYFGQGGNGEARAFEGAFDGRACFFLILFEHDAMAAEANDLAFAHEVRSAVEDMFEDLGRRGAHDRRLSGPASECPAGWSARGGKRGRRQ